MTAEETALQKIAFAYRKWANVGFQEDKAYLTEIGEALREYDPRLLETPVDRKLRLRIESVRGGPRPFTED